MSIFGLAQTNSTETRALIGYRVQTSIKGTVRPVILGTNRVPGYVLYSADWQQIPDRSSGKGKGGIGGKSSGGKSYIYESAIILGLCRGPITGVKTIWRDQVEYATDNASQGATIPSSPPYDQTVDQANLLIQDNGVAMLTSYSQPANDYGGPGPTTLTGTTRTAMRKVSVLTGASGEYTTSIVPTPTPHTKHSFNAADAGKQIVISYTFYIVPGQTVSGSPLKSLDFFFSNGALGQSVWPYFASNHQEQALGYSGTAYVANQSMSLGSSGVSPNYSFEIAGLNIFGGNGILDAKVSNCIDFCLQDGVDGAGFDSSLVGPYTAMDNWTLANNIFLSPAMVQQRKAADWITEFLVAANTAPVFSDGVLKFIPYGDTTCVGNGATFIPNTTPIYDLNDDWIMGDIEVSRKDRIDADNAASVQFNDRNNGYNADVVSEKDEWAIGKFGLRDPGPITVTGLTSQKTAATVANVILKNRIYKLNTYKVPVSARGILLEPMDIVRLTRLEQGLNQTPVRITEIAESADLKLTLTCEEFPWGTAQPTLYPKQPVGGFAPGYFDTPGSCNPPFFYEAQKQLSKDSGYVLLIALSGGTSWGGATVWVSRDGGVNYVQAGQVHQAGATAAHVHQSGANTLSINLTECRGIIPTTWSQTDVDNFLSLVVVDDELIAYRNAALASSNWYDLTYLRRGVFGTPITPHLSGARFATLFSGLPFSFPFEKTDIGTTLWFKFTSYNLYGQNEQSNSDATVVAYPFYVTGIASRLPYGPNGGDETPMLLDPLYTQGKFLLSLVADNNVDGSAETGALIGPRIPATSFSTLIGAPVLNPVVTVSATGGSLVGPATLYVAFAATDSVSSSSAVTDLSNVVQLKIPSGTTGSATIAFEFFDANSTSLLLYAATIGPQQLEFVSQPVATWFSLSVYHLGDYVWDGTHLQQVTTAGTSGGTTPTWNHSGSTTNDGSVIWTDRGAAPISVTITSVLPTASSYPMPDSVFDHFVGQPTQVLLPGIFSAPLTNFSHTSTNLFTFAGATFGTLTGRVLSDLQPIGGFVPLHDWTITSNTATTITTPRPAARPPHPPTSPNAITGDMMVIRLKPTTFTGLTIGDSMLPTIPVPPTLNQYQGDVLRAFYADDSNQSAFIASYDNTTGIFTLQTALNRGTPLFFWVETPSFVAPAVSNTNADVAVLANTGGGGLLVPVPNQAGFFAVQLSASDANGNLSIPDVSPIRDFYQAGSPGSGGDYQISS